MKESCISPFETNNEVNMIFKSGKLKYFVFQAEII